LKADDFTGATKSTLSHLGIQLNKFTGYEAIEALKRQVAEQGMFPIFIANYLTPSTESRMKDIRKISRDVKITYSQAVAQRANSQREVNDLLQRKSIWTDSDLSRFTTLVRQDHMFEQEEARAKQAVEDAEDTVEREFNQLMRTILARYHEEQVWSDKIRSASTYGQIAALGLNLLVFMMAITLVEPWKRQRLAQTFEKKVDELSEENRMLMEQSMKAVAERLDEQARALAALSIAAARQAEEAETAPGRESWMWSPIVAGSIPILAWTIVKIVSGLG
jgi:sensitive to high expression protein 9